MKQNNQWHSVAHSMPMIGRKVLFYFPAINNIEGKLSEKIEIGIMETPKRYGVGGEWLISRASCDGYGAGHRAITHWAEIGTQGVPNDTGFVFSMNMMCLNPVTINCGNKNYRRIIEVAEICGSWFYGFSWEYNNHSGYYSGCRPRETNFRTKEEAVAEILAFHRERDEQKTKKVTKQMSLF